MSAIEKALKDLDSLGEGAVRKRILGLDSEEEKEEPSAEVEMPAAEASEEEMDDETKKKLLDLLQD